MNVVVPVDPTLLIRFSTTDPIDVLPVISRLPETKMLPEVRMLPETNRALFVVSPCSSKILMVEPALPDFSTSK